MLTRFQRRQRHADRQLLERLAAAWRSARLWLYALALALATTLILCLEFLAQPQVEVELGRPARETITAPHTQFYISEVRTLQLQDQAAAQVPNVYGILDRNIGRSQASRAAELFAFLNVVRADQEADTETRLAYLQAIEQVEIDRAVAGQILTLSNAQLDAVQLETLRIIDRLMRTAIRTDVPYDAREMVHEEIGLNFPPLEEGLITHLASQFITPNQAFDAVATARKQQEARDAVSPQDGTILRGEIIVAEGQVVDDEQLEKLQVLGLLRGAYSWLDVARNGLAATLTVGLLAVYWERFNQSLVLRRRYLILFMVLWLVGVVGVVFMFRTSGPTQYLFPLAGLAMVVLVLYDLRLAAFMSLLLALLAGYVAGAVLEPVFYLAMGSLVAIFSLRDPARMGAFFRAGLAAVGANLVVALLFNFAATPDWMSLGQLAFLAVLNGVLSASFAIIAFYLIGTLFGIVTIFQLQDLGRFDQPLLQELVRRAPGSYHHSIMVANLAEQAAGRVGANGLLVRVGAFYHDIGKLKAPRFFTENQTPGENPHDTLDPLVSASIVRSHVTEGLALARSNRLPRRIQDFIVEHHGDRVIWSFYRKAVAQAGGDEQAVDKALFRYQGPRPRSRETAIVHLADMIEATSKAVQPNNEIAIEKLVTKLVEESWREGQLDDSGLTVGDIRLLRESFIETMQGRFHTRVEYPGNEELVAANGTPRPAVNENTAVESHENPLSASITR